MMINVADLKDPNDKQGRSWREINLSKKHNIELLSLVEIHGAARAYIVKHTRDCDGTPLYSLAINVDNCEYNAAHGYAEESLTLVSNSKEGDKR